MRTFSRVLRILSAVTLFFFCWTFLPLWQAVAFAATGQKTDARGQTTDGRTGVSPVSPQSQGSRRLQPAEQFEAALDSIREKISTADEKAAKDQDVTAEIAAVKKQRTEIEKVDIDLRKE